MIRAASKDAVEVTAPDSGADIIPPGQHAHPLGFFRPQNAAEQTVFKRKQNARYVEVWCS